MSLRDAIKGFAQGLRTNTPNSRSINTLPGAGQIEVVDTSQPPTRYNVPGNWSRALLGPGQPFSTDGSQTARGKDAENEPRSFQYISSVNSTMSPRLAYGLVAFSELRSYAESVPEVSMCLRLLTEEMKAFVPTIVDMEDSEVKDSKYDWMTKRPDGFNPFPVWLSKFLYNTLIYDAGCAYMVRNSMKKIVGSRVIDGSTIFVVIDERGEQPRPPAPAFQQIIWGVPRLFMNTRQLWYKPRHLRADAPYGRSPIEDSLPAVKLLQSLWDYEYQKYQVGNIPEMVFTVPENWKDNVDAILEFELAFNARMAGNNEERARARFLPAGMNALNTKELSFNKESYDSATNAVRMSFGILQSEVGEGPNSGLGGKGYAEAMQSAFYRMGLAPLISYVESHFNDIIAMNGDDGVKFKMEFPAESLDPSKEEEKFATRFQIGGIKRDEYRQGIGMEALGGEMGEFIVQPGGGGGEGEDPFGGMGGAGAKPGMLNVGNSKNIQVRRPLKVLDHPLNVLKNPVPVSKAEGGKTFSTEQAREIGDKLGVDWATIDLNEFTEGLAEEHEHADTVEGDLDTMANIALDHLKEDPQYYSKLKGVFSKFDGAVLEKMVGVDAEDDMLFGAEITNLQDVKMPKQGANETLIVSIGGGSVDARPAVWKPVSGEKPELQEFVGGEMFRRAEAVYLLDRELAPDEKHYLVPLSYMSQQGDDEGSVQHYITHRKPRKTVTSYEPEWIEQAAVLDYISGQLDRKQKNYLTHPYNEKRPVLIDSELSFSPDPKKRIKSSFVEAWAGEPLTDKTLDSIYLLLGNRDLWEDLLDCLDDEQAVENARERAQEILDAGMLPKSTSASRLITVSRPTADNAPVSPEGEARPVLVKYDENQPRDEDGQWTAGGGGASEAPKTNLSNNAMKSIRHSAWVLREKVKEDRGGKRPDIERGFTLDKDGEVLSGARGDKNHSIQMDAGRGQVFLHTHPTNEGDEDQPFSAADINAFANASLAGAGVVTNTTLYWIEPSKENSWHEDKDGNIYNIKRDLERSGGLYNPKFDSEKFAKEHGLTFLKIPITDDDADISIGKSSSPTDLAKAEWKEDLHPRDKNGEFTEKGKGVTGGSKPAQSNQAPAQSNQAQWVGGVLQSTAKGVRTAEFQQKEKDLWGWNKKVLAWEVKNEVKLNGKWTDKYRILMRGLDAAEELERNGWDMEQPDRELNIDYVRRARAVINKDEAEANKIRANFPIRRKPAGKASTVSQQKKVQNIERHKAYFNSLKKQQNLSDFKDELFWGNAELRKNVTHVEFYGQILSKFSPDETPILALVHVSGRLNHAQREHNLNIGVAGKEPYEYEFVDDTTMEGYRKIASVRRDARLRGDLTSIHAVTTNPHGRMEIDTEAPTVFEANQQAKKQAKKAKPQKPVAGGAPAKVLGGGQIDPSTLATSRKVTSPERKQKLEKFANEVIADKQYLGGGANDSYKVRFPDNSYAAMKPLDKNYYGQYGFPIAEGFCSDLSEELGLTVVPVTGYRREPNMGLCTMMDWVENARTASASSANMDNDLARDTASQMVVLTTFTGNTDRHGGNWMIDNNTGQIHAIDNGFACALETIGYDPWNRKSPYDRAKAAYIGKMNARKDYIGPKNIPNWRIKPEHLKAVEDFMADDAKVDALIERHFATDDFVETIHKYEKSGQHGGGYVYARMTDDQIKAEGVKRCRAQLEGGLKFLKEAFDDQKNW